MEDGEGFVRRALREPTLHFALLAALLFLVAEVAKSLNRPVVEIDPRSVELRIRQLERGRGTPLNETERRKAEEAYIDEQVLAREARVHRLDDDEKIRSILYQKMLHVLSGAVPQPTDAELEAYFEDNRARYAGRPAVTVEDVVVGDRLKPTEIDAGFDPDSIEPVGRARRGVLTRVTESELAWSFGEATAAMVFGAETGKWVGPHQSVEGEHWFRVIDRIEGTDAPALDIVREQVRFDWMAQKEDSLLEQRVAELRERYSVRFSGGSPKP
jgi:peptidyl-prolyl cis-trans isomerase C